MNASLKLIFTRAILLGTLLVTSSALKAQGATKPPANNHIDVSTLQGTVRGVTPAIHPVQVTATNMQNNQSRQVVTSPNGAFVFNQLPDGNYRVIVDAPGYPQSGIENVHLRDEPLTITLRLGAPILEGRIIVRVLSEKKPVDRHAVKIENLATHHAINGTTDSKGEWAAERLEAGSYEVSSDNGVSKRVTITDKQTETVELEIPRLIR
jgi:hypothetical protein